MRKVLWLLVLALAHPLALASEDTAQTLTILGTADWKGRFSVDPSGRGGLAALRAFYASLDHRKDRGHTLLFHTGAFSGAENAEQFKRRLSAPSPNLAAYMGYSNLGFPAAERVLAQLSRMELPAPLFTHGEEKTKTESPRSLLLADGLVYTTTVDAPADRRAERIMELLWQDASASRAAAGVILLPSESAAGFFGAMHIQNVHSPRPEQGILIFIEPAKADRFYRDPAGPLVCSIQGRSVCVIEIRLRGGRILSTAQRFVDLGGRDNPSAFLKPDPVLMDLFPGK